VTPEEEARKIIDEKLEAAGWRVQDRAEMDLTAGPGVAVREFPLRQGFGLADYMLYADRKAVGVVEAKPLGHTLTGVEAQAARYADGLPEDLPAHCRPLLCAYQSDGEQVRFTNNLDPDARSRDIFHFHRPEALVEFARAGEQLRGRLREMPPLEEGRLWSAQIKAIKRTEESLAHGRPRALVQMATGSGKTFTAANLVYRLIKHGDAKRVLFLVDRFMLGRQANSEFTRFKPPDDNRQFGDLHVIQHLRSNKIDPASEVVITTVQRLYSMLSGEEEFDAGNEQGSMFDSEQPLRREPPPIKYNPALPIETFDIIVVDECHRSIYGLWRQVLEYFDAFIIGLTATPSMQTVAFFKGNLVMEYGHKEAVADGVNVDFDVYRIETKITKHGATVPAQQWIDRRDRLTRRVRYELLDEDLTYTANQLDRDVVSTDQIRTCIKAFRDGLPQMFPGRTEVPKTLIYAKDDSHADDIVKIVREEFGKGNDFCQKITYRTGFIRLVDEQGNVRYERNSNRTPEDVLSDLRNSHYPRIAVTVDLVATGTDVKPLEIVVFMRNVKSALYFDQMKGRGVRVISDDALKAVSGDAKSKDRFVIVDCVGVCEQDKTETVPLERQPSVSFKKLLNHIAMGGKAPDALSTLASRLARLNKVLSAEQKAELTGLAGGSDLSTITRGLVRAIDPDEQERLARSEASLPEDAEVSEEQTKAAYEKLAAEAVEPILKPDFRKRLLEIKAQTEQTIDRISRDEVISAEYDSAALERARGRVESFKAWIEENKAEITALKLLYSGRYANRLRFAEIKELATRIQRPPLNAKPDELWRAFEALEASRVRGSGGTQLVDIVSLVRHAIAPESDLVPFKDVVSLRYSAWLGDQIAAGAEFTREQKLWLDHMAEHIATSFAIEREDFELGWFAQHGDLGKAHELFGTRLDGLLTEMNEALVV